MNDTNFDSNADVQLKEITNFNELKKCLDIILKTYKDRDEKLNLSKENNMRHSAMTFEQLKEMYDCGIKMYGYFKEERVIAFISLEYQTEVLKIKDIVVLPEYQANGIGTKLLNFAKEQARENNKLKIILGMIYANEKLKIWYEKNGFKIKEIITYPSTGKVAKMEYIIL
ncbi:MAG: GNAT family N-acetyltransferase [Clostridia bacterium]|nr:GNAT family N-acetyltransferase [Clostridia bacterium]